MSHIDVNAATTAQINQVVAGGTQGSLLFIGVGSVMAQANTKLFYDETNAVVSLGQDAPTSDILVNGVNIYPQLLIKLNSDGNGVLLEPNIALTTFTGADPAEGSQLMLLKARGTEAAPTTISNGDWLAYVTAYGWTGSDYIEGGQIAFQAAAASAFNINGAMNITLGTSQVSVIQATQTLVTIPVALGVTGVVTLGDALDVTGSISTDASLAVAGSGDITGNLDVGGALAAGTVSTGANFTVGGAGNIITAGVYLSSNTTESTSKDTGSIITDGGLGVEKNAYIGGALAVTGAGTIGGALTVSDATQSTDKDTGSLILQGGAGIEKNLYVGGNVGVTGTLALTALTQGSIPFIGASGVISQSDSLFWDNTNKSLCIGQDADDTVLAISGNTRYAELHVKKTDASVGLVSAFSRYGGTPVVGIFHSGGTEGAKTVTTSGVAIGQVNFYGHDGTDYESGAIIQVTAHELWTGTSTPAYIRFFTNPVGSVGTQERLNIHQDGHMDVFNSIGTRRSDVSTTSTIAALNATGKSFIRFTGNAATTVQGIFNKSTAGISHDGSRLVLVNGMNGTNLLTIAHSSGSANVNDRIILPNAADLYLLPNGTVELIYDNASGVWRTIKNNGHERIHATSGLVNFPITANQWGDLTSISLTAGVWMISCRANFYNTNTITTTRVHLGVSTTTGNSASGLDLSTNMVSQGIQNTTGNYYTSVVGVPTYLVQPSSTTTYYLKSHAETSITNLQVAYTITAWRMM